MSIKSDHPKIQMFLHINVSSLKKKYLKPPQLPINIQMLELGLQEKTNINRTPLQILAVDHAAVENTKS